MFVSVVPSEKSDTRISMVQPTKDRLRDNVSEPLDRARAGRVLPKRKVRPYLIIIAGILRQKAPKVRFAEYDTWSVHSWRVDPIKRSTWPFCQGERKDVGRCVHRELRPY